MAEKEKETVQVTEPARPTRRDPRNLIYVFGPDGKKLESPVPETWLDQFPQLKEVPSKKGK